MRDEIRKRNKTKENEIRNEIRKTKGTDFAGNRIITIFVEKLILFTL